MEFKILLMEKFTTWSSGSSAVGGGTGRPVKRLDLSSFQDKRLLFKTNWRNNTGSKSEKKSGKKTRSFFFSRQTGETTQGAKV